MEILDQLLTKNPFSRTGKIRTETLAVVLHWTGNPKSTAKGNRDFFEGRKAGKDGYGSAQLIVGLEGEIIRCIPDDEVAYAVGSSQVDPKSNKIYTDYARGKFGKYCLSPNTTSPNNCTISIEMCHPDSTGKFKETTLASTAWLVSELLKKYKLTINDITTHSAIVGIGYKKCPLWYIEHPEDFVEFKKKVNALLIV